MTRLVAVVSVVAMGATIAACGGGNDRTSPSREEALLPPSHYHAPKSHHQAAHHPHKRPEKQKDGAGGVPSGVDPAAAEEIKSFSGVDRQNWELGFQICGSEPEKQLAREYHTEESWAAIGHAYGSEYKEPFNIAAEEGCMLAVKDSEAEWEAALEELPFKGL